MSSKPPGKNVQRSPRLLLNTERARAAFSNTFSTCIRQTFSSQRNKRFSHALRTPACQAVAAIRHRNTTLNTPLPDQAMTPDSRLAAPAVPAVAAAAGAENNQSTGEIDIQSGNRAPTAVPAPAPAPPPTPMHRAMYCSLVKLLSLMPPREAIIDVPVHSNKLRVTPPGDWTTHNPSPSARWSAATRPGEFTSPISPP